MFHLSMCAQVEDLGLEKEILSVRRNHLASKNRYLYVNKKLHRMPSGLRWDIFCGSEGKGELQAQRVATVQSS